SLSKVVFGLAVAAIALAARSALPPLPPASVLARAILSFVPRPLDSLVLVSLVATMQTSADIVLLSATAVTARALLPPLVKRGGPAPVLIGTGVNSLILLLSILLPGGGRSRALSGTPIG